MYDIAFSQNIKKKFINPSKKNEVELVLVFFFWFIEMSP